MKKIILFLILISSFILSEEVIAQDNFGRPQGTYTKHQRKNLKRFHGGKRHKRFIPFNDRSGVSHPSVRKDAKKNLRRKYREEKLTRSNY